MKPSSPVTAWAGGLICATVMDSEVMWVAVDREVQLVDAGPDDIDPHHLREHIDVQGLLRRVDFTGHGRDDVPPVVVDKFQLEFMNTDFTSVKLEHRHEDHFRNRDRKLRGTEILENIHGAQVAVHSDDRRVTDEGVFDLHKSLPCAWRALP